MNQLSVPTMVLIGSSVLASISPAVADEKESNIKYILDLIGPLMTEQNNSEDEKRGLTRCEKLPEKHDIEFCEGMERMTKNSEVDSTVIVENKKEGLSNFSMQSIGSALKILYGRDSTSSD